MDLLPVYSVIEYFCPRAALTRRAVRCGVGRRAGQTGSGPSVGGEMIQTVCNWAAPRPPALLSPLFTVTSTLLPLSSFYFTSSSTLNYPLLFISFSFLLLFPFLLPTFYFGLLSSAASISSPPSFLSFLSIPLIFPVVLLCQLFSHFLCYFLLLFPFPLLIIPSFLFLSFSFLLFPFLSLSFISSFLISCLTFFFFTSFSSSPFVSFLYFSLLCTASFPLLFPIPSFLSPSTLFFSSVYYPLSTSCLLPFLPVQLPSLSTRFSPFLSFQTLFSRFFLPYLLTFSPCFSKYHPSLFSFFSPHHRPSLLVSYLLSSPILPLPSVSPLSFHRLLAPFFFFFSLPPHTLPNLFFSHLPLFSCLPLLISLISFSPVFLSPLPPSLSTVPETSRALPSFPLRDRPKRQHGEEHPQQLPRHAHAHDKVQPEGRGRSSGEPQNRVHFY